MHCVPDNVHICWPIFFIFCTDPPRGSGYRMNQNLLAQMNTYKIVSECVLYVVFTKTCSNLNCCNRQTEGDRSKPEVHAITTIPRRVYAKFEENRPTNVDIISLTVHSHIFIYIFVVI